MINVRRPTTYDRAERGQQIPAGLEQVLLGLSLEMESSLSSPLIGRSLDFDLVLCHYALHDLAQVSRFAILASTGQINVSQTEAVCGKGLFVRSGDLDAWACS